MEPPTSTERLAPSLQLSDEMSVRSPVNKDGTSTIVIEPRRSWVALNLRELWAYRDLLYFTVWRDLKARYRQTALGPLWIVLQPIVSMVLYTIIFGVIAKLPSGGVPYQVLAFSGLLPWGLFEDSVGTGSVSLQSTTSIISKVYFPRLLIPLSRTIISLVDLAISLLILGVMLVFYRIVPNWGVLLLPLFLLVTITTGVGFGFLFSGLVVKYRDVGRVLGYITRFWMYASPVAYSSEIVPSNLYVLYHLNPMANVIDGFRWALLGAPPPNWGLFALSALLGLGLFVVGLFQFKRVEQDIVDIA